MELKPHFFKNIKSKLLIKKLYLQNNSKIKLLKEDKFFVVPKEINQYNPEY